MDSYTAFPGPYLHVVFFVHSEDLNVSRQDAKLWLRRIHRYRARTTRSDPTSSKPLVFISTVNGYHHFRTVPQIGENYPMSCVPEPGNRFDQFACLVKGPGEDNSTTYGRVPKNICNVISLGLGRHNALLRASCFYMGHMVHDGQRVGGGPKLVCMYVLEYKDNVDVYEVANHLRRYVNENLMYM
ncbi:uncharacterized protein LOC134238617 [Saccostrea cucullata]|uniref:uncharacterized protein LOC134238617 n=1 Tax=Saccostrea cuccullata TaxID=36930 RepID=UPI002ED5DE9E